MSSPGLYTRDGKFELYQYTPSIVAAVIFIILFFGTTALHIFQASKRKTYSFIPLIIGGIFEVVGYAGRAYGHSNKTNLAIYILSTVLLLVAPALFAASIYMILGRVIIFSNGEKLSPIRPSRLTKIFVCGDVASFLIQSLGGGMVANSKTVNTGKNVILLGLALQIIFFGLFLGTSVMFHLRAKRSSETTSHTIWQKYIFTLYISSILILVRSVFRMIEFGAGRSSVLQTSEVFLYIFDAVLMLGAMVCFNVVHPGDIIGRDSAARRDNIMLGNGYESSQSRGYDSSRK